MNDRRFHLAGSSTIRFKDGHVMVINYRVVDLPVQFEKRGRRFRPAWVVK